MDVSTKTIVYVGYLGDGGTASRRARLFEEMGWRVVRFDTAAYYRKHGFLNIKLANLGGVGPIVDDINVELGKIIIRLRRHDVVFFDKPINIRPAVLTVLRSLDVTTISYMPDDPFGPRRDGVWRLFFQCLPIFDLHLVPRQVSVTDFRKAGAKQVEFMAFSFDPCLHIPATMLGGGRPRGYSYVGSAYDKRPQFLRGLHERLATQQIKLTVTGSDWLHWRHRNYGEYFHAGPNLWGADYRDAIWDSCACLAFVTRSNRDELSHKAIEIAACGRPPVLEPTNYHKKLFEDGVSAIFFESLEECANKLIYYWDKPQALDVIGAAAADAVRRNDHSEARVVAFVEEVLDELQRTRAIENAT